MNRTRQINILDAVLTFYPGGSFTCIEQRYDTITWKDFDPIAEDILLAKHAELQAAEDALAYARAREEEYPELKEFAEAYCEKEIGGNSTKWDAYVLKYNKVRADNPKP